MGRFATTKQPRQPDTVNAAGGAAYELSLREQVATVLLTTMLKRDAYTSEDAKMQQVQDLCGRAINAGEAEFLAKAAIYARHEHGLRTITHVVGGELSKAQGQWKRPFFRLLARRPDDICETLAYFDARFQRGKYAKAMLRGFGDALEKYDAYQLAKYRGTGRTRSLVDCVNICHPTHTPHLAALVKGTLGPAETWEQKRSEGQKQIHKAAAAGEITAEQAEVAAQEQKKATWAELINTGKLGYLAALRNLRNIVDEAPECLDKLHAFMTDPKQVEKCGVFPHQFATAYRELAGKPQAQIIAAEAAELAIANVPKLRGKTCIAIDASGSMSAGNGFGMGWNEGNVGQRYIDFACLMAAALLKANPTAQVFAFGNHRSRMVADVVGMRYLTLAENMAQSALREHGSGTNFACLFHGMGVAFDRVVLLSDMQNWGGNGAYGFDGTFKSYRQATGADPYLYSFDLSGTGTSQAQKGKVATVAGWSEKIFDIFDQLEIDPAALVKEIDRVVLK